MPGLREAKSLCRGHRRKCANARRVLRGRRFVLLGAISNENEKEAPACGGQHIIDLDGFLPNSGSSSADREPGSKCNQFCSAGASTREQSPNGGTAQKNCRGGRPAQDAFPERSIGRDDAKINAFG